MKVLSADQIRLTDQATIQSQNIRSDELMERAASAFTAWLLDTLQLSYTAEVHIFCGPGNNGGDGLVAARLLHIAGYTVQVWLLPASRHSSDFDLNRERLPPAVPCQEIVPAHLPAIAADAIVIDALFGTGLSRELTGAAAAVVQHLNHTQATIIAVDIPSGLFTDAPQNPESIVIRAHYTVSFELPKLAFLLPQNAEFVGEWQVLPINLDRAFIHNLKVDNFFTDINSIAGRLPTRAKFSHKGTFGHALLLAGSQGKIGAAVLASQACLRGGVGLLTVRVPAVGYAILQTSAPEAMALADPATDFVTELPDLKAYAAIGIGPGLGQEDATCEVLRQLLRTAKVPLVIDADALNMLGAHPTLLKLLPPDSVLTPHPKEFERLVGQPATDDYHRLDQLRAFAQQHHCYCILKGAYTALATPDGNLYFNSTGNPGMATGGSGDVLTGLLLALRADKRLSALDATLLALYVHGQAGDLAAQETGQAGLIAGDIVRFIGPSLQQLTTLSPMLRG